jgi:glutamate 5-kinase
MSDILRQEIADTASTIVVKVGTRVLTDPQGRLDPQQIIALIEQVNVLMNAGRKVVLVSSGAVGAGLGRLGMDSRPTDLAKLQAVAAIGQSALIEAYERSLHVHGHHAAQVLLAADDLEHRTSYLNAKNTIRTLLQLGAVPIINENDTVAVDELQTTFGDNDRLAAIVTNLIRAPLLVLLSDVKGLYDGDPTDPKSRVIDTVENLDQSILDNVVEGRGVGGLGKGGMGSKLEAARLAIAAGENVIIAGGREPRVLERIVDAETVGTLILAQGHAVAARKRWIGFSIQPRGSLTLDDGAARAVKQRGSSLLAVGISTIEGEFGKGDVVALLDPKGVELGRGFTNYSSENIAQIKGHRSDQIASILGHCPYDEVIHRDNMVVTR